MNKKPTLILHLGVHKTATTHIQSRLLNSMETLKNHKISYIPLKETRKLITSKLLDKTFHKEAIIESMEPYLNCEKLIISDENIIGGTDKPKNNQIYYNIEKKLSNFLNLFEGYNIQAHITLRNYVDYFISRYTESLRHFKFVSFEKYYKNIDFHTVTWIDTVEYIRHSNIQDLTISSYENIFKDENKYLEMLTGLKGVNLEQADISPATKRSKFSQQGYEIIKFYAQNYSDISTKNLLNFIDRNEQITAKSPFMPFSMKEYNQMSERYDIEFNSLSKG